MPELKEPLSERELEILRLVATGAANKEIARQLLISPNTVKVHLRNIFTKIGVTSRTEATLYAVNTGLVKSGTAQDALPAEGGETAEAAPEAPPAAGRRALSRAALAGLLAIALLAIAGIWWAAGARQRAAQPAFPASSGPSRWLEHPALPAPRAAMGAALYENAFYLIGGQSAQQVDGAVLRFDLLENAWQNRAAKQTPVRDVQAALLGEKIYVPGGCQPDGSATDRLEVYDPRLDVWERKAPMPAPRCAYALAAFEGRLYLFGGKNGGQTFASVYMYDPQEDAWQERTALDQPRAYAAAEAVGGKIYVVGGLDGARALRSTQAYLPARDANGEPPWETLAPLPAARYGMGLTHLVSTIYLLGGAGEDGQAGAPLQYNVQLDEWVAFDAPPAPVGALPALLAAGNYLYVFGGETGAGLSGGHQAYQAIYTVAVPILQSEE